MKKLISFVLATVLCLGMTTAVMATPSVDTEGAGSAGVDNSTVVKPETVTGKVTAKDADGTEVIITTQTWEDAGFTAEQLGVKDLDTSDEWLTFAENATVATGANPETLTEVDDVFTTEVDVPAGIETIEVEVAGVTTNDKVVVLLYKNNAWKAVTATVVRDGVVAITSDDYCPVAILIDTYEAPVVVPPTYYPPVVTPTAPKTADVAMFGMVAMAALAGTVAAARKAKENK